MGESVDESKLPPKAQEALRQARAMIRGTEITTDYLKAIARVRQELPEGIAQGAALHALEINYAMQIRNLINPPLNLQGGQVGYICRTGGTERNG